MHHNGWDGGDRTHGLMFNRHPLRPTELHPIMRRISARPIDRFSGPRTFVQPNGDVSWFQPTRFSSEKGASFHQTITPYATQGRVVKLFGRSLVCLSSKTNSIHTVLFFIVSGLTPLRTKVEIDLCYDCSSLSYRI